MESPIKEEILYKRVVAMMDLARMTPKMKQEIINLMENEFAQQYYVCEEFIYPKDTSEIVFRLPANGEEKRDISLIAPFELEVGILALLDANYEMTQDAIGKEISGLIGYPRRTKKFNDYVEMAVRKLSREGKIHRFSGGFRLQSY